MESSDGNADKVRRSPRAGARRKVAAATPVKTRSEKPLSRADFPGITPAGWERANRVIAFCECLRVPSGIGQGDYLVLRRWQKRFIYNVYGPSNAKGRRTIRRALLSIARKNGKTALAAALVLVHLLGPEAKRNGEVYSAASDRKQAGHIYKMAAQMVELDPELNAMCKRLDSVKRIVCYQLGSFYESLSADARRQHGFNPTFVVYDELAQALNRDLYDVLTTSFGAQEEGLFLAISTQSSDPQSIMSSMADDAIAQMDGELKDPYFYGIVYAVPEGVSPYDQSQWPKANPALDDFRSLIDMQALAASAERSPSAEASFRNLYLNQRVDGVQSLVNSLDWRACRAEIPDEMLFGIAADGGLDLSTRHDLTSLTLAFPLPDGRVALRQWFWTPENDLKERSKADGADYLRWQKEGYLTVLPGKSVDYAAVAKQIGAILAKFKVRRIRYDRWRIEDFRAALDKEGITAEKLELVEHGQGYKDMAPAIDALEELVLQHELCHGGNPLLTYCMGNVKVSPDMAGNRKFDKRARNRRIDGAVTLAMAVSSLAKPEKNAKSYVEATGKVIFV